MAVASATSRPGTATGVAIPKVNLVPGYGGFCPAVEKEYGKTYGDATRKYYELSRQNSLSTSRKERSRSKSDSGVSVVNLSLVTHQSPSATQSNNVWSRPLPYTLNLTGPRREKLLHFNQSAQTYRDYYKDHSGMALAVPKIAKRRHSSAPPQRQPSFSLPPLTMQTIVQTGSLSLSQHTTQASYPTRLHQRKSSAKERATRDVFFQKR